MMNQPEPIATRFNPPSSNEPRLLLAKEVLRMFRISSTTLERWIAADRFPKPIKIFRRNCWVREELEFFLSDHIAKARGGYQ